MSVLPYVFWGPVHATAPLHAHNTIGKTIPCWSNAELQEIALEATTKKPQFLPVYEGESKTFSSVSWQH